MKNHLRKGSICFLAVLLFLLATVPGQMASAKTITKITSGGYAADAKNARIKGGKLVYKGRLCNWARATNTPEYDRKGTFRFKLASGVEILDGYRDTTKKISKKQFNKLCKKHDSEHEGIVFMIENNKVTLVQFW